MRSSFQLSTTRDESLIASIFQRSVGQWRSERRYYTLSNDTVKEIVSALTVRFLTQGCPELIALAELHQLSNLAAMTCGALVTWDSADLLTDKQQSQGTTLFGVIGSTLYRDRGFATPKPITASFFCPNPDTLCLRTEYRGSAFEEELKLISTKYRTRQTIISRAGEEQMIGQYLEKRMD
jgi:CpeS-like protein